MRSIEENYCDEEDAFVSYTQMNNFLLCGMITKNSNFYVRTENKNNNRKFNSLNNETFCLIVPLQTHTCGSNKDAKPTKTNISVRFHISSSIDLREIMETICLL